MTTEALADEDRLNPADLRTIWRILTPEERVEAFHLLPRDDAEEFFLGLSARDLAGLMLNLPRNERRSWMRLLAPDDAADLVQEAPDGRARRAARAARRADAQGGHARCSPTPRTTPAA